MSENRANVTNGRERGQRVYDWWSRHRTLYRATSIRSTAAVRKRALSRLDLRESERVLEIGCGHGVNFEALRGAVGPDGTVVGVEFSPEMARQAERRVREHGWSNVHVIAADATRTRLAPGTFDAAIASLALSATSDVEGAIENVREALGPGGRFVVFELELFDRGPLRLLNPIQAMVMRYAFNRQFDQDVAGELRAAFGTIDVETFDYGSSWVALAAKPADVAGIDRNRTL